MAEAFGELDIVEEEECSGESEVWRLLCYSSFTFLKTVLHLWEGRANYWRSSRIR